MVRPPDLPQPVRQHESHESKLEQYRRRHPVPGPGAYHGTGINEFSKSRKLGFFCYGSRFSPGQLDPSDLRTPTCREQALDVPGPKYDPKSVSYREAVKFPRASRDVRDARDDNPGPGQYVGGEGGTNSLLVKEYWNRGVSFARSLRERPQIVPDASPAPGAYSPVKPSRHKGAAVFGSAARSRPASALSHSLGSASRSASAAHSPAALSTTPSIAGASAIPSLEEEATPGPKYNPDYTVTMLKVAPDISFGKAPRTFARPTSATSNVSPYQVCYSAVDKCRRSAVLYLGA